MKLSSWSWSWAVPYTAETLFFPYRDSPRVDRAADKDWPSSIWKLGLCVCSSEKLPKGSITARYRVKCLICENHRSAWVKDYEGTNPFSYAEHVHPKEPKVEEWLHQIAVAAAQKEEEKRPRNRIWERSVLLVFHCFSLSCSLLFAWFAFFSQKLQQSRLDGLARGVANRRYAAYAARTDTASL